MLQARHIAIVIITCFLMTSSLAEANSCDERLTSEEQTEKILTVNLVGIGAITTWGIAQWDYFSRSPQTRSEGWFQEDTLFYLFKNDFNLNCNDTVR